ncbi:ABC transporter substrate-binding protein [Nocardioides sp. GXZ039]|uniref:ABC transporter substrate-binding protein n=1 Tax=Nocardioides sp. GXZ039 TaxID=3136018 RepID=UPI0030F39589
MTPTRRTARRAAALVAVAALSLSACGSDDGDDNDNESSAPDPGTSETSDTTGDAPAKTGDGTLKIGALLPTTGDLAYLGPPEIAGVQLAIDDINAAGGVNGKMLDEKVLLEDSGDGTPDIAGQSVDALFGEDVDVIVGAAASGVSLSVIDKITSAGVLQISPANTAPAFDTYDDKGLYFRTAPSDRLQGQVIGDLAVKDGFSNVAVMARQDAYGEGLAEQVETTLKEKGASVPANILYAADAENFTAEINQLAAAKPDAIVLITFEEITKIVPALTAKGLGPDKVQYYFVDGNMADYSDQQFDLTGVKGTFPAPAEVDPEFNKRLDGANGGKLEDYTYGPQSYDATVLVALAAIAAGDDSGESIASQMQAVSRDGTKCTAFKECADLLADGEDIDYDGVSGPVDLNDNGSPNAATIGIQEYTGNKYKQIDSVGGVLE